MYTGAIATVIADGSPRVNPCTDFFFFFFFVVNAAALCTAGMVRFFHPQLSRNLPKAGPHLDQMIDFVLAGSPLACHKKRTPYCAGGRR